MRGLLFFAGFVALGLAPGAGAADQSYLRGYGQAIVDRGFADLNLRVRAGRQADSVTLSGDLCLDRAERRSVARALTGGGPIRRVEWRLSCHQPALVAADPAPGLTLLPEAEIFQPLQADPREPQLSMSLQYHDIPGEDFTAGLVNAGETFSLIEGGYAGGIWQLGIQGGVFSLFDLSTRSNDLLNVDYLIAGVASYRDGPWSYRGRYFHQSSHLGDEFLIRNPNSVRENISFEAIDVIASYDWNRLRLYGGGGAAVRTTLGRDRGFLQAGGQWRSPDWLGELDLFIAADFKAADVQDWEISQAWEVGLILNRHGREIRLELEIYDGNSPHGQFFRRELSTIGLGLQFGI